MSAKPTVEWVRLKLDVDAFDAAPFLHYLEGTERQGFTLTTMAALGDTPANRRALYELNRTCSADIPDRGEFYTFEEYVAERIEVPSYYPRGVVLAHRDNRWVGMAATSVRRAEGFAFSEMTGVLIEYRRRGLAVAMKLSTIQSVRSLGMRWLRTVHHPLNAAAIGVNRRLGFVNDD